MTEEEAAEIEADSKAMFAKLEHDCRMVQLQGIAPENIRILLNIQGQYEGLAVVTKKAHPDRDKLN